MAELERLEKQMEGTNLALAAVAEVLQKMDSRLSKEDAVEIERLQKAEAQDEQSRLVKAVAEEVFHLLKEGTNTEEKGLDVSGEARKAKATGKTAANADDAEKGAPVNTKLEDQQNTIQAMYKADDDDEEEEDDMEKGHDDEEEEDFPVEEKTYKEDDDEEMPEDEEMKSMKKQLDALKKQISEYEGNMEKAIADESQNRLRKMGFREERGLAAPAISNGMGVDGTTVIQKAQNGVDVVDQLAGLSYNELRKIQQNIEMGNTDGVPRELLG